MDKVTDYCAGGDPEPDASERDINELAATLLDEKEVDLGDGYPKIDISEVVLRMSEDMSELTLIKIINTAAYYRDMENGHLIRLKLKETAKQVIKEVLNG